MTDVVNAEAAQRIVRGLLTDEEMHGGVACVLVGDPEDHGRWWVQGYQSRAFVQDGDIMQALAGNGPFAIPKDGSKPFRLGSAEPAAVQLQRISTETRGEQ